MYFSTKNYLKSNRYHTTRKKVAKLLARRSKYSNVLVKAMLTRCFFKRYEMGNF